MLMICQPNKRAGLIYLPIIKASPLEMIGKQNEFPNVLDEEGSNIENDRNEFAFKKFEDQKIYTFL